MLTASGEFDVHDAPIDLGIYHFEDWILVRLLLAARRPQSSCSSSRATHSTTRPGWTEEIARYLLICTVFIGATVSVRKNNHIHVDFFYRILPKR